MVALPPLSAVVGVWAWVVSIAVAHSPTDSYTPGNVSCPNVDSLVRKADSLNPDESKWVSTRLQETRQPLIDFLQRANMTDFDPTKFLANNSSSIPIGLAFSGGGYRAMLSGAGQFASLDARTPNSTNTGHLGGIVQAATYLAGLSGGNWLVGSIVLNNFSSIPDLQNSSQVWDLDHSIIDPSGLNIFKDASYWDDLKDMVDAKQDAGFNTSITDIWGRGLSQQFIGLPQGGPALTWDDIRSYDVFQNHSMPFPIVVTDGREPGTTIVAGNSTVFEVTPFELGSWDPSLYSFTDIKYLGTPVDNGKPQTNQCIAGFDNAGFVMGTSSSLFNQFILQINSTGVTGVVRSLADDILNRLGSRNDDIAIYSPNPFKGVKNGNSSISNAEWLTLVDGGEDGQNVPLYPLIQSDRNLDVIFSFDNSADTTYSWPNGTSLIQTYERQFIQASNHTAFPYVPDSNTFINQGLTEKPTFFGCYANNLTSLFSSDTAAEDRHVPPLIIYVANFAHNHLSNTSTFKLSYSKTEVNNMITNGYNVASRSNSTFDEEWPACVGCALVQRELERRNQSQTEQCKQCFQRYCWSGTTESQAVNLTSEEFDPTGIAIDGALSLQPLRPFFIASIASAIAWLAL